MKRYLLIQFDHYYPKGGISDVVDSTDDLTEAINWFDKLKQSDYDDHSFQIFDCVDRKIIRQS